MKARFDIIQGTEDWHKIKYRKIGGTASAGLFVNSDTLALELLSEHLEDFELEDDGYINADMQRGNDLEPLARTELSKYANVNFKECGWLESEEITFLGISPDGITEDFKIGCEIKCPSKKKHTEYLLNKSVPKDHVNQCLHNFTVNKYLEKLYFLSFRPESEYPLSVRILTRDSEIDLGTKAKPNIKPISEWSKVAKGNALKIESDIINFKQSLSY